MTQELITYTQPLNETMEIGKLLAQSGYFADSRDAAQAVVKVLAGRELGFGPIASMTGVNIIKGKVTLSANLIAAAIKRSGRYNYRVVTLTDEDCRIDFYEKGERIGTSTFSMADAKEAGLTTGDNWRKFKRNMLFARAISNGAKWYCPDLSGGPLYTPDELGATVDGETGEVIDQPARTITVERPSAGPTWTPSPQDAANEAAFEALPSASAERAGNNGKSTPPKAERPQWKTADEAIDWGNAQGCFDHRKHAENAFNLVVTGLKETVEHPKFGDVFNAWYADVQRRVADNLSKTLDAQAAAEAPHF